MEVFEKEVAGQITVGDPVDMCVKLLANNLEACIMLFLGGASFGILTLFILGLNGLVIGSVTEIVSQGHSAAFIAAALLPHGIFEIPAFIIAGALGFCYGSVAYRRMVRCRATRQKMPENMPGSSSCTYSRLSPSQRLSRLLLRRQSYIGSLISEAVHGGGHRRPAQKAGFFRMV